MPMKFLALHLYDLVHTGHLFVNSIFGSPHAVIAFAIWWNVSWKLNALTFMH